MNNYANMRYVGIFRTSSNLQSEKSIPDQQKIVADCATKNELISAGGDLIQSGISASKRRGREDIDNLIERKKALNDFDVVVIHDYSRLTRRGVYDAFKIEGKLNENGIRVISATEMIPEGPYAPMIKSVIHAQHNQYVRDGAQRITRGQMSSILQRRSVGPTMMSYGIDRLYASLDGTKHHHILRLLPDGSQVRLHPSTGEVLSIYEKVEGGKSHFYRRQANEKVILVPGNSKHLDVVRRIFQMVVIQGLGYHNVAKILHQEGIDSPLLGKWAKSTVKRIVSNPLYTGRLIANRYTRAEFYMRSKDGPEIIPEDSMTNTEQKTMRRRPKEDWVIIDLPETAGILDEKLREASILYQDQVLTHDAYLANRGIKRDKHTKTSFILKDVLTLKQDGSPMCGMISNQIKKKGRVYRYYRPRGYGSVSNVGGVRTCRIPAEPLEAFVLDMLSRVFSGAPDLRDKIKTHVIREQKVRHEAKTKLEEIEKQKKSLVKKVAAFADVGGEFDDEMVAKVQSMRARIRDLDLRLKAAQEEVVDGDADEIADSVVTDLSAMGGMLKTATPTLLRKMLSVFVEKMECDPQTREVWLTLRIPSWATNRVGRLNLDKVCLEYAPLQHCVPEANYFLLGKAQMRCLTTRKNFRGALNLRNYRFCVTDGPLTTVWEQIPSPPATEGIAAAAFQDVDSVYKRSPYPPRQRKRKVYVEKELSDALPILGPTVVTMALPTAPDAPDMLTATWTTSWSYWTPGAIAA